MTTRPGFIALISVLIVCAVALLIGIGITLRAVGDLHIQTADEDALRAHMAVTSCAERGLIMLRQDLMYSGNETRTLGNGDTCHILPIAGLGNINRVMEATSTVNGATRKLHVVIYVVNPYLRASSWQEVADF
jgi:hypothetical protein